MDKIFKKILDEYGECEITIKKVPAQIEQAQKYTLRDLRKKAKKTLKQLGEELNVKGQTISNYENGRRALSFPFAIRYAKALNVSIDQLARIYKKD